MLLSILSKLIVDEVLRLQYKYSCNIGRSTTNNISNTPNLYTLCFLLSSYLPWMLCTNLHTSRSRLFYTPIVIHNNSRARKRLELWQNICMIPLSVLVIDVHRWLELLWQHLPHISLLNPKVGREHNGKWL
mmetsp:Transcript_22457/g.48878  ORF Transcript_22457/g.48878 Transcript_22457/m.48878 type:complete len:131 (+) Transcript_22457:174-566(+)